MQCTKTYFCCLPNNEIMQRERERGDNKKEAAKMKSEQIMNKEQSISSLLVAENGI